MSLELALVENKMSSEALEILKNKVGYRDEGFRGSGERKLENVLLFECLELCNDDILVTLAEIYGFNYDSEKYKNGLYSLPHGFKIKEFDKHKKTNYALTCLDNAIKLIKEKLDSDTVDVLWVCATKQDVIDTYTSNDDDYEEEDDIYDHFLDGCEEEDIISTIQLPKDMIIISDLGGRQGVLTAFKSIW